MENGDSIVSIWAEDSIYNFPVDENRFFSGKVKMTRSGYATLLHNSLNLYLSPGEDLEIYMDALNFSGSLYFRGSLGGMNNSLKEQEVAVFFDKGLRVGGEGICRQDEKVDQRENAVAGSEEF